MNGRELVLYTIVGGIVTLLLDELDLLWCWVPLFGAILLLIELVLWIKGDEK